MSGLYTFRPHSSLFGCNLSTGGLAECHAARGLTLQKHSNQLFPPIEFRRYYAKWGPLTDRAGTLLCVIGRAGGRLYCIGIPRGVPLRYLASLLPRLPPPPPPRGEDESGGSVTEMTSLPQSQPRKVLKTRGGQSLSRILAAGARLRRRKKRESLSAGGRKEVVARVTDHVPVVAFFFILFPPSCAS